MRLSEWVFSFQNYWSVGEAVKESLGEKNGQVFQGSSLPLCSPVPSCLFHHWLGSSRTSFDFVCVVFETNFGVERSKLNCSKIRHFLPKPRPGQISCQRKRMMMMTFLHDAVLKLPGKIRKWVGFQGKFCWNALILNTVSWSFWAISKAKLFLLGSKVSFQSWNSFIWKLWLLAQKTQKNFKIVQVF